MSNIEQAALDACNSEPIQFPNAVQAHGAMIVCDSQTMVITHASDNMAAFLGHAADALLGVPLRQVLDADLLHKLRNAGQLPSFDAAREPIGVLKGVDGPLDVAAFATGAHIVLEFERSGEPPWSDHEVAREVTKLLDQINEQTDVADLLNSTVRWLGRVTGFDRVMVYKFDGDGSGEVIAEHMARQMDGFLGLRFPSWDIPQIAREIMTRVPLRVISDVQAQPVPLIQNEPEAAPIDLTLGQLRAVSPVHLEYLSNMGVRGTATLSIVVEGALWGLIAFHHRKPRVLTPRVRAICLPFIAFLNVKLAFLSQREAGQLREKVRKIQAEVHSLHGDGAEIGAILLNDPMPLMSQFEANGMLLKIGDEVHRFGSVIEAEAMAPLVKSAQKARKIAAYRSLSQEAELSPAVLGNVGGALVVPLIGDDYCVVFRDEVQTQINWAGAPDKDLIEDDNFVRLAPRGSFALYSETVRGRCEPWRAIDLELADGLATIVIQTASQRARLERDFFEERVRQQNLMIGELNHRVRNILTLIQGVSRGARHSNQTLDGYAQALESRISALAFAHDLSTADAQPVVSLAELIQTETKPYISDTPERLGIIGTDVHIRTDLCTVVVLAVHELVTNASKYGALSNETGVVEVTLKGLADGLLLSWREYGGPEVEPPGRKGFGRELIEGAIPYELGGRVELSFEPEGVAADIWLPAKVLGGNPEAARRPKIGEAPVRMKVDDVAKTPVGAQDMTVLLVEDNYVISMDMEKALRAAGYGTIQAAGNVSDALEILEHGDIDMAVLDMHLGSEDSFPVAERLRVLDIPFLFATGYGSNLVRPETMQDIQLLTKPVDADILDKALAVLRGS